MFIELGESIGNFLVSENKNTDVLTEIESILSYAAFSAREGTHCVKTANRLCASQIKTYLQSRDTPQSIFFNYIYSNFSTYLAGLKNLLDVYVAIEVSDDRIKKNGKVITVNTNFAARNEFWCRVSFLPENIVDYRYFLRIAYYEKQKNTNLNLIDFSLTPEQGAGGRTIDTYTRRCCEEKFILAILDSDCCFPGQSYIPRSCADDFDQLNKSGGYITGSNIILNIHEIENLFSSDKFLNNADLQKAQRFINYNLPSEVRQYYDFKNGFAVNRLEKNAYMKGIVENASIQIPSCNNLPKCRFKYKNCGCQVVIGLGGDFLEKLFGTPNVTETNIDIRNAVQLDFNSRLKDAPEDLIDPIKQEWLRIYKAFLSFFCSFKQVVYVS